MESVLQRITIIGEILAFRELLHKAIHDVLELRLPFLLSTVHNLHESCSEHNKLVSFNRFSRLHRVCRACCRYANLLFSYIGYPRLLTVFFWVRGRGGRMSEAEVLNCILDWEDEKRKGNRAECISLFYLEVSFLSEPLLFYLFLFVALLPDCWSFRWFLRCVLLLAGRRRWM